MFYVSINEQNKTHHDNGVTKQHSVIAISYFAVLCWNSNERVMEVTSR
jgi:hypothetical protein